MKDVIPAAAHGRRPGPVHQGQMLEDLQDDVVGQAAPVLWGQSEAGRPTLLTLGPLLMGGEGLALCLEDCRPSSFHPETFEHIVVSRLV